MTGLTAGRSLVAGILAGIGASLCCVAPLVLLALGISGAWIADLTALEPYRPAFAGVTLVFFGIAFRKLYLAPACAPGAACSVAATLRRHRRLFWISAILTLAVLSVPSVAPLFY